MASTEYRPRGILVSAESIGGDGEDQGYAEVVVTLEDDGAGDSIIDVPKDQEEHHGL